MLTKDTVYAALQRAQHRELEDQLMETLKQEEEKREALSDAAEALRVAGLEYEIAKAEMQLASNTVAAVKELLRTTHEKMLNPAPAPVSKTTEHQLQAAGVKIAAGGITEQQQKAIDNETKAVLEGIFPIPADAEHLTPEQMAQRLSGRPGATAASV